MIALDIGVGGESQEDADVLPPLPPAQYVPALGERDQIRWLGSVGELYAFRIINQILA